MVNKGDRNIALFLCPGNRRVGISRKTSGRPGVWPRRGYI